MPEVNQAIGALGQVLYNLESVWGTLGASNWRGLRLLGGETLDENVQIYRSRQLRADRTINKTVRGSQKPGGTIPFELGPAGWSMFLWHLLGNLSSTTGPTGGLINPPVAATGAPSASGGTLASASYYYSYTGTNATGETLASPTSLVQVVTGPTGSVVLTLTAVVAATGYNIYRGSTSAVGTHQLIGQSVGTSFTDIGQAAVPQFAPTLAGGFSNTTGAAYVQTIKGSTTQIPALPVGFTLEKQFLDIGQYQAYYGCRVNKMSLSCNVDKIVEGQFDILSRQASPFSATSICTNLVGGLPAPQIAVPVLDPFTAAYVAIYEGPTLTLLGTATEFKLDITNQLYGDRGFILGSNLRQNLKPGDRLTTFSGKFMFQDASLYNKAKIGTATKIRLLLTQQTGPYSCQIDLPNAQFLPSNSVPKIVDEGPLMVDATGEAVLDPSNATDVIFTITTPEAVINT